MKASEARQAINATGTPTEILAEIAKKINQEIAKPWHPICMQWPVQGYPPATIKAVIKGLQEDEYRVVHTGSLLEIFWQEPTPPQAEHFNHDESKNVYLTDEQAAARLLKSDRLGVEVTSDEFINKMNAKK